MTSFLTSRRWYPIPREPLPQGRKIHGGGENLRFLTEIAWETVKDRPMVAMER